MNYFDIIFIIILAWSTYRGYMKGFIFQAASLAALLLGIYGAIKFSHFTAQALRVRLDITSEYLPLIAFAITFILIVILIHFAGKLIEKIIKAIALGYVNKILGILFSLAKAAFIISVILTGINSINANTEIIPDKQIEKSLLYKPLSKIAPAVFPYLHFEEIKQNLEEDSEEPSLNMA